MGIKPCRNSCTTGYPCTQHQVMALSQWTKLYAHHAREKPTLPRMQPSQLRAAIPSPHIQPAKTPCTTFHWHGAVSTPPSQPICNSPQPSHASCHWILRKTAQTPSHPGMPVLGPSLLQSHHHHHCINNQSQGHTYRTIFYLKVIRIIWKYQLDIWCIRKQALHSIQPAVKHHTLSLQVNNLPQLANQDPTLHLMVTHSHDVIMQWAIPQIKQWVETCQLQVRQDLANA